MMWITNLIQHKVIQDTQTMAEFLDELTHIISALSEEEIRKFLQTEARGKDIQS